MVLQLIRRQAWLLVFVSALAGAQTSVFNATSFTTTNTDILQLGSSKTFNVWSGNQSCSGGYPNCPSVSSGVVVVASPQTTFPHDSGSLSYQTAKVGTIAFTSSWTFKPNGQYGPNFVLQNNTGLNNAGATSNCTGTTGANFASGAGGEQDLFQGYDCSTGNHAGASSVNNIFGLSLDSYSGLTQGATWTCSSVQVYGQNQSPYLPESNAYIEEYPTNKISTCPTLNLSSTGYNISPGAGTPYPITPPTTTGTADTFSATVTYTGTIFTLQLYDATAGGSCGTTPSNCFTYSWPVNIPAMVGGTTAWVALAEGTGSCSGSSCGNFPLIVITWSYSTLSAPSAPSYSVAGGSYGSSQSLTLTDAAPVICYTTNGTNPATDGVRGCAAGTLYTGSITISGSETVKSVAGGTNYADSTVASNFYNINSTPDIPVPSVGGQPYYNGAQQVFLTAQVGATIRYSTSSFSTCSTGTLYSGAITVSSSETLYYLSCTSGGTASAVGSTAYVINPFAGGSPAGTSPAAPAFSVAPGTYGSAQTIGLSSSTSGAYICYTTDGSDPYPASDSNSSGVKLCNHGTLYSGTFSVSSTSTVKAIAALDTTLTTANGGSSSATNFGPPSSPVAASYIISGGTAATPTFSPAAGSYGPTQSVTISDSTSGASIYYCTSSPCTSGGTLVTGTVSVSSSETLYAYATASGYTQSATGSAAYTINGAAATPTFSPAAATYTGSQSVTASTSTSACSSYIYFDTNPTPTTNQSTMSVPSSETVYAYVHGCPGYSDSLIASAAYTIDAFTPIAGQGGNIGGNVPIQ